MQYQTPIYSAQKNLRKILWFSRTLCSSEEQVQRHRQQRVVPILLAVSGHQKQQQNHQQILRVEISRKQMTKKTSDSCRCGELFSYLGTAAVPGRRRTVVVIGSGRAAFCVGRRHLLWGRRRRTLRVLYSISAIRAVRLWNIAVIHSLPPAE